METGTITLLVVVFVVIGGGLSYVIAVYNGLIQVRNNTEKAFNNIDVLLEQRYDELPRLVEAARGYMKHEQDLLKDIVELRMCYTRASDVNEKIDIENRLGPMLSKLNLLVEQYPDLKAIESFNNIQVRVSALEEQIADRRELFNDSVNIFNIRIESFPDVIFARMLNYEKKPYLEVPDQKKQVAALGFES